MKKNITTGSCQFFQATSIKIECFRQLQYKLLFFYFRQLQYKYVTNEGEEVINKDKAAVLIAGENCQHCVSVLVGERGDSNLT